MAATCNATAATGAVAAPSLSLQVLSFSNATMSVGARLKTLAVTGNCATDGKFTGTAELLQEGSSHLASDWVVTQLSNTGQSGLKALTLGVVYDSDGHLY